jgi:hypothetical protein
MEKVHGVLQFTQVKILQLRSQSLVMTAIERA